MKAYCDTAIEDPLERKLTCREEAYLEASEMLCRAMKRRRVSKAKLATAMGVSRGRVSQLLDGKNLTLATIQDALTAMGMKLQMKAVPERSLTCD